MKLRKTNRSVMSELASKMPVREGLMAELDILAQESNSYQEFEKRFMEEYNERKPLAPEEKELLQQLYADAKTVREAKKSGLIEVVSAPLSKEVVAMIYEVAEVFGAQKLPKKQWKSTVSLVRYIAERLDKKDRIEFARAVKSLRESRGIEEFVIKL